MMMTKIKNDENEDGDKDNDKDDDNDEGCANQQLVTCAPKPKATDSSLAEVISLH